MVTITLTEDEQTIELDGSDIYKVTNVRSFQNLNKSNDNKEIRWSTMNFSSTNDGSIVEELGERVFSDETEIYFKGIGTLQIRAASL